MKRQFGGRDIINFKYSVHFMHIRDRFTTNEVNSNIEDLRNIFFFFCVKVKRRSLPAN